MENTIDLNMSFDFDTGQFDGATLRNLVHMIYSREHLLNKSTGGCFHVAPTLIQLLSTCVELDTVEDFLQVLVAHDAVYGQALHGIEITSQHVRINGFGEAPDVRTLKAYGQLAVLMATRSRELRYVYARHIPVTNELFTFRAWIVTLGMNGADFKETREILLARLSGCMGYRTPQTKEKALERAKMLRARKEKKPRVEVTFEYVE